MSTMSTRWTTYLAANGWVVLNGDSDALILTRSDDAADEVRAVCEQHNDAEARAVAAETALAELDALPLSKMTTRHLRRRVKELRRDKKRADENTATVVAQRDAARADRDRFRREWHDQAARDGGKLGEVLARAHSAELLLDEYEARVVAAETALAATPDYDQMTAYIDKCHAEIDAARSVMRRYRDGWFSMGYVRDGVRERRWCHPIDAEEPMTDAEQAALDRLDARVTGATPTGDQP